MNNYKQYENQVHYKLIRYLITISIMEKYYFLIIWNNENNGRRKISLVFSLCELSSDTTIRCTVHKIKLFIYNYLKNIHPNIQFKMP